MRREAALAVAQKQQAGQSLLSDLPGRVNKAVMVEIG